MDTIKELLVENTHPWAQATYERGIDFFNSEWNEIGKHFMRLFFARMCADAFIDKDIILYEKICVIAEQFILELQPRAEEKIQ